MPVVRHKAVGLRAAKDQPVGVPLAPWNKAHAARQRAPAPVSLKGGCALSYHPDLTESG